MDEEEFTPGTVHLVDMEGTMRAKHALGTQQDIVLIPPPSNDPDDPLSWSPGRKLLLTTCICVYTLIIGFASAATYSVLEPISKDTGLTLGDLNAGTGYMAILIWAPYTTTNGEWTASKILQGFFGAPIESLCEISVTDIYFTHERGTYLAIYALFLVGGSFLAPVLAGFINDGQGWRWVLYWCAIFCAIGLVFLFFFMEETNYRRQAGSRPGSRIGNGSESPSAIENSSASADSEKSAAFAGRTVREAERGVAIQGTYRRKTYLDKLKLFEKSHLRQPNRLAGMMLRPLIFLTFPVIFYVGFCSGSNLVWFNVLNGTASLILSGKPYNFASSMVGLSYLSPIIGVIIGSTYTGRVGDWLIVKLARRNKGIMEPEHRLWLFCASLVLIPGSLILWGVGAAHGVHWFGLVFAMALIAATNSIGVQVNVAYCIDSYRDLSGEAIVSVVLVRNTMSFAVGYGLTTWVTDMGLQSAFIVAAFAGLAQVLTFLVFVKWGKAMRRRSVGRYWKYVKEMSQAGLTH